MAQKWQVHQKISLMHGIRLMCQTVKKKHKLYQSCCFCDEAKSDLKMANNINIPGALFLPDKGRNEM